MPHFIEPIRVHWCCGRLGLDAYSKDLEMHKAAVALHFGVYNFVRRHKTLGTTPAVAAGIELEPGV
jgi:hypothetical protein